MAMLGKNICFHLNVKSAGKPIYNIRFFSTKIFGSRTISMAQVFSCAARLFQVREVSASSTTCAKLEYNAQTNAAT